MPNSALGLYSSPINLTALAPDQANEYVYFVALNRSFTEDPVNSSWVSSPLTPNLSNLV